MNVLFFIILTLVLFIFQTVVFPNISFFQYSFDLLVIEILYISLIAKRHTAIAGIIIIGCIMDSISGVPFFYHVFSYVWIYFIVQLIKQLFFQHTHAFILVISLICILVQQGLLLICVFVSQGTNGMMLFNYRLLFHQILLAVILIPPSLWVLNVLRRNFIDTMDKIKKQVIRNYKGEL